MKRSETRKNRFGLALANEGESALLGLSNEFAADESGWVKITPYGDFPKNRAVRLADGSSKREEYIQRVDRAAAEAMVAAFNSPIKKFARAIRFSRGVPIYKGHPDLNRHAPETATALANASEKPHGMFTALEAREDGFYGRPVLDESGQLALENEGLKHLSPFWWLRRVGQQGEAIIVTPTQLISAGMTDHPNIEGGEALANQREQTTQNDMNKEILIALLCLANTATEADITRAIQSNRAAAEKLAGLETEKKTTDTALANEKTETDKLRAAFSAERKARIDLLVGDAIRAGRITQAQAAEWTTALANEKDFAEKSVALANTKAAVKTTAATADLGARKGEQDSQLSANSRFVALVNERCGKGGDYNTAWNQIKAEQPALFEQMSAKAQS